MSEKTYAEVVVNLPLRPRRGEPFPGFHYFIPEDLRSQAFVGRGVLIPFGPRLVQGVIFSLSDHSPVEGVKPIAALLEFSLPHYQLRLAEWMSKHYLAPISECVALMTPPGIGGKARSVLRLSPEASSFAPTSKWEEAILNLLRKKGEIRAERLEEFLGPKGWHKALRNLLKKGIVIRQPILTPPIVAPKRLVYAFLVAPRKEWLRLLEPLRKRSRKAEILEYLVRAGPIPSLKDVMNATGSTRQDIRQLEEKGLVQILPSRQFLIPAVTEEELAKAVENLKKRARAQLPILEKLLSAREPVPVEEFGDAKRAIKALEDKGLVRTVEEEEQVLLTLPPEEAIVLARKEQGLSLYLEILEVLYREKKPVSAGDLYAETGCTFRHLRELEETGLIRLVREEVARDPLSGLVFEETIPPDLTSDQEKAWEKIKIGIEKGVFCSYLLFGVTGSGKTEIYLRAIEETLRRGRQAIVLIPEISLTPQTVHRFGSRFPGKIAVIHSKLSLGERYDTWWRIRRGQVSIVIGPRSALFVPLPNPGLIVVDEEHDRSYKSQKRPYYHARDVAMELGRITGSVVILGSATPDLGTFYRARKGEIHLLELPKRILWKPHDLKGKKPFILKERDDLYSSGLPPVEIVDMREEFKAGHRGIFSRTLIKALEKTLNAGEQAILFLNRRGTATFIICSNCGYVAKCKRCDVPLTYHRGNKTRAPSFLCHHCGRHYQIPANCPACGSPHIRYFGLGTEKVEDEVIRLFPSARTLRLDRDTVVWKHAHQVILEKFASRQADILVGTQMIAKGLDLPYVTLVGVISADTALHLPDLWAAERTFQLLMQVAGRAGRSPLGGRVIIQTYTPNHYAIELAARHDYEGFFKKEMEFRHLHNYPPLRGIIRLLYQHSSEKSCREKAENLYRNLIHLIGQREEVHLIGPVPCFFSRLRGRYRWQIILLAPNPQALLEEIILPGGWKIEVDPVSLL
ncbi:MAG: primosomal protein N' [Anaerolineae bacterium]|nr:primosomal protein N' [Anaerolineae bacterium]MDW8101640.1 primosomal protein N' [Anaerolineae bacterium]